MFGTTLDHIIQILHPNNSIRKRTEQNIVLFFCCYTFWMKINIKIKVPFFFSFVHVLCYLQKHVKYNG